MAAKNQQTRVYETNINQLAGIFKSSRYANELNIQLKSENPISGGVWFRFHHGTTFSSWGEKITVSLLAQSESRTTVSIESECGMPTQIFDWGKNAQNVNALFTKLEQALSLSSPAISVPQTYAQPSAPSPSAKIVESSFVPTEKRFCVGCGKPVGSDDNFCAYCGTKIR